MKLKICTLSVFFLILLFFSLNTAWPRDPIPRFRSNGAHKCGADNRQEKHNQARYVYKNKTVQPFEKAKRLAWADRKLTYRKMQKLHQLKLKKKLGRDVRQWRHHGMSRPLAKGRKYHRHGWSTFPKFTLHLSFADPGTVFSGPIGVK